ncbi:hypothetical protein P4T89_13000 [Bacillus nakamurai]|uniref:Uncharacterized protein n=1 Tax=Bacillus nakamurai TaxID=1793963 RepID=A0A150FB35_9BACI|nr:hypothetical protein [Bacillus nakamurai]KXZ22344.1 hypothetical protein AXI58_10155 [Bacillus nakamurai]MED1228434.1 hypothetical protein [Bacillus nakamurai]
MTNMRNDQMREKIRYMLHAKYEDGGILEFNEFDNLLHDLLISDLLDLFPKKALKVLLDSIEDIHESMDSGSSIVRRFNDKY